MKTSVHNSHEDSTLRSFSGFSCSLVPRPFPPPVFDCLRYANIQGESLGGLVTCGDVSRQSVHTWVQCPTIIILVSPHTVSGVIVIDTALLRLWPLVLGLIRSTIKGFKILHQAPPPMCLPSVYLMSLHVTKAPRPSLSAFAYCKLSKTRGGNGLETRFLLL